MVVKGVLRADDARRCVQAGAAAVWVSNHGGRQLDRAASTASALGAVVAEVADEARGLRRRGSALAGSTCWPPWRSAPTRCFLGRLPVWALVEGEAGVARMHADLRDEVTEALRLAGCRSVADTRGIAVPPEHP